MTIDLCNKLISFNYLQLVRIQVVPNIVSKNTFWQLLVNPNFHQQSNKILKPFSVLFIALEFGKDKRRIKCFSSAGLFHINYTFYNTFKIKQNASQRPVSELRCHLLSMQFKLIIFFKKINKTVVVTTVVSLVIVIVVQSSKANKYILKISRGMTSSQSSSIIVASP